MDTGSASFNPEDLLANAAWMRRLALGLVRDDSAADDLVQETWLRAVEKGPEGGNPSRGRLRAVLRNFAVQKMRSDRRRQARELRSARPEAADSTPDGLLERVELERWVVGLVLRLDEPYRSTVLLRFFEGLEPAEIARRQGVAEPTVR